MKRQEKKKQQELLRRYGKLANSMAQYYHHLDLRILDELDDDALEFILGNVKGADMLDLNETNITNRSIRLLTRMEYIKELRLKGCDLLDDGCVPDLARINGLEFLHLRHTRVTVYGALKMGYIPTLKCLMLSADDDGLIAVEIAQLKILMPGCEILVNGKTM